MHEVHFHYISVIENILRCSDFWRRGPPSCILILPLFVLCTLYEGVLWLLFSLGFLKKKKNRQSVISYFSNREVNKGINQTYWRDKLSRLMTDKKLLFFYKNSYWTELNWITLFKVNYVIVKLHITAHTLRLSK